MAEVQTTIFDFMPANKTTEVKHEIPKMPAEYKGKINKSGGYTKTAPREWTDKEIEWVQQLHADGYTSKEIAQSIDRSEVSTSIKLKRLTKSNRTYNAEHIHDKYATNDAFMAHIKPFNVLDVYAGMKSYYKGKCGVVDNDINPDAETAYHLDALKFVCKQYYDGGKYDIVDLDPFGSAFDCFDLAVKMARKGLIITFGEIGHKRWKRLDYVSRYYGINTLDDFTLDNLIKQVQSIGRRNKKELIVYAQREWRNIGRVWFEIKPLKITEQWGNKND